MIDKDKLIQFSEEKELELSREQIDALVESASLFCGVFPKPYEVRIDFGPIVIDMLALITELKNRVKDLEDRSAPQQEISESIAQGMGDIDLDSVEL